jgi:4-methoxybenzoate monooxygenase (O-demethylating)
VARGSDRIVRLASWVDQQCQREALTPGGFGAQVWQAADRSDLALEQAPLVVRSLLSAGVDTTVHGIGATLFALASQPGAWQQLRDQPQHASVAFEEAIRWESPVQTFFRTTTSPIDIDGVAVEAGRKVLMFLGSANRDPRRWPRADEFDLTRDPSGHVGFGMGLHQCVGQHVARLEGQAVLQAMLRRIRDIELVGEPRRHLNNTMRAWKSLPVRVRWS